MFLILLMGVAAIALAYMLPFTVLAAAIMLMSIQYGAPRDQDIIVLFVIFGFFDYLFLRHRRRKHNEQKIEAEARHELLLEKRIAALRSPDWRRID